jgi:hypothetical protein
MADESAIQRDHARILHSVQSANVTKGNRDRESGRLEAFCFFQPVTSFIQSPSEGGRTSARLAMHFSLIASGRQPESCQSLSSSHQPFRPQTRPRPLISFRLFHHRSLLYVASCLALRAATLIGRHPGRLDDRHASQPFRAPTTPMHRTNFVRAMVAAEL